MVSGSQCGQCASSATVASARSRLVNLLLRPSDWRYDTGSGVPIESEGFLCISRDLLEKSVIKEIRDIRTRRFLETFDHDRYESLRLN